MACRIEGESSCTIHQNLAVKALELSETVIELMRGGGFRLVRNAGDVVSK
jgi:hypothetical protein